MRRSGRDAPLVCVVVLNWNSLDGTLACLRALAATRYPNMRTIVVDNGSSDDAVAPLADLPGIDLVRNAANLGFTGGANVGIERAVALGAAYVWLLNSDAATAPDVLGKLVDAAEADPAIGLVSPVFHDPESPDVPEFCLGLFDPVARYATQTNSPAQATAWQRDHPSQVILLGTALLIRRELIDQIGGLDPGFFAYVEDVDYSLRAIAAGYRNVAVPDAVVLHKFKQPVAHPDSVPAYLHYYMSRNYLLLWKKLARPRLLRKAMLWFLRQRLLQIERMTVGSPATEAVLAGLWDGMCGVAGPYDPTRRAPPLMRWALGRHAGVWLNLLDGRLPFAAREGPNPR